MSTPDPAAETQTFQPDEGRDAGPAAGAYLLCIDGASSSRCPLPRNGVLVVGRAPDADLRVDSVAISRRHARFIVAGGEVQVADMGSHNGTVVNGERIEGARALASGDVVCIGDATFVLRSEARAARRPLLDAGRFRLRLEEELERAADYGRPLAVVAAAIGGGDRAGAEQRAPGELRLIDVAGWDGAAQMVAVLPELGGEAALSAAAALVAALGSGARGGLALYPADGGDADTLLAGARAAAQMAAPGAVAAAGETAVQHAVGESMILVADPAMIRLFDLIRRLARSELAVLVMGETGAGKENAAAAVHHWSARAARPLVTLNCAALPETLVESELFGFERGAFSDARAPKPGLLERASGGTVFLDEIGELGASAQAKLLRAIEARRITRLGDVREREVDIRVVAATNRDLDAEVKAGRFRQDLLFRLSAAVVHLPPLRHRPREVPILARAFLARARAGKAPLALSDAALVKLEAYAWPGNVRELKNAMEFAAATAEGDRVQPWDLPERVAGPDRAGAETGAETPPAPSSPPTSGRVEAAPTRFLPIAEEVRQLEKTRMEEALVATGGVQTRAAELISMPIRTFVLKLKQYGISARDARKRP